MFEAYKVATRIEAIDATGGTILSIAAQFTKASKEASGFLSTLRAINAEIGRTAKGWGAALADDFAKATRAARDFSRETRDRGPSTGSRGRGMSVGGSRGGLMPWPSDFGAGRLRGSHTDAEAGSSKMPSAEQLSQFGAAGLGMLKVPVNAAIEQEQATNRLTAMNLGAGATSSLLATAKSVSETTPGLTLTDAIKLTTDTQGLTSNVAHTQALLPGLAKMRFGISAFMGEGKGEVAESQFQDIVKAMEMRGLMSDFSPEKATAMEDMFTKSFVASGGQVDPARFVNMMKTGGAAMKSGNTDFTFALGHMMQEDGGKGTSASVLSSYNSIVAGKSQQQVAEELNRLGLLDSQALQQGSTGHLKEITPAALKDTDKFIANPLQFMNENILPGIARKDNLDIDDPKNQGKILGKLSGMFGDRTGSGLFGTMFKERGEIGAAVHQASGAMGVDALARQGENSTYGNLAEYQKQVSNLESTLGKEILPTINTGLKELNPYLRELASFMGEHGSVTKGLVLLFAGVSGMASVAGGIKSLGGTFSTISEVLGKTKLGESFGALGTALEGLAMPVAAVLGAAGAGAVVGTAISDHLISGTTFGDKLGHAEAWVMAKVFRSKDAQEALDSEARYNALTNGPAYGKPAAGNTANITVPVTIDGREIGRAVTLYQIGEMSRPQGSISFIDTSRGVQPIGYTGIK